MKTDKIAQACGYLQETHDAEFASAYGEPGYSDTPRGVILANWNNIPRGLADWLESCGFSLEWSDEWAVHKDKAYRTQPDCYQWRPSLMLSEAGEYIDADDGPDCAIEECANSDKGQPIKALPHWVSANDLAVAGFVRFAGNLESGFHPGQDDKPDDSLAAAVDQGAYRVTFLVTSKDQFDVRYECWAEFDVPEFDRSDICAAHARLESDWNIGGMLRERPSNIRRNESTACQMHRLDYHPGHGSDGMTRNAWAIYHVAVQRMGLTK